MEPSANIDLKNTVTKGKLTGLWRLMRGYHGIYLVAIISVGLAALSRTGLYVLLGKFVDEILPSENIGQLLPLVVIGLLLLALLQGGFTFLGGRLAAKTAEGVARRLRNYLYNHLQRLSFSQNDRLQTGDLLQRSTSDVDTVRRMFAEQVIGIGRISLLFIVNFIAISLIDLRLALISVAIIPVILGISLFFFVKVGKAYETFQEQEARLSNQLQENLTGVRVVKAFARQDYEKDAFEVENEEKYRRGRKLTLMHATYWPTTDVLAGVQMILGFYVAAVMALNGEITVGMYIAYAGFVVALIWPIRNLGRLIADVSTGFVSFGRIQKIIRLDEEPLYEGAYPERPLRGEIVFDRVNFTYEGEEGEVLHDISFTVRPGQKIAIMGGTGSGKTSLVNLLPRFYDYSDGRILLDGAELTTYSRDYLRQQIGIVMQEPFLFSTTIRQNITYGVTREVTDEEVYAAARAAAVHDVILSFPEGYDTLVGERGVTLSGGQKQRITLARTILRDPSLLILDDATSSVDTETAEIIRNALDKLMRNRTTFLIAH
ncbi:MAG TPA: ABC transporter ATP-binding protein, partial [Chloroflexi bacterium]|nr:ABC transporter ATP-binding protein [Chloroflexota bacterium]